MTTKAIKRGKSGFVMTTVRPDNWANGGVVTCDVLSKVDGIETPIIEDAAVEVYTGDTLAEDVLAGSYRFTLVYGEALEDGQQIRVGSAEQGYQTVVVDDYYAPTKSVSVRESLDEDLRAGSTVSGCELTTTIDASLEAFDNLQEVSVRWKSDGDDVTMSELWRVLSVANQPTGLSNSFRLAYPACYDAVTEEGVPELADRAEQYVTSYFTLKQRDYKLIVDNESTKELIMLQMALLSGEGGDLSDQQYIRLTKRYEDLLSIIDGLPLWIDDNEDGVEDDSETQTAQNFRVMRCL